MVYRFQNPQGQIHSTGNPDRAALWEACGWRLLVDDTFAKPSEPAQAVKGLPLWLIVVLCFIGAIVLQYALSKLKSSSQ